MVPYVLNEGVLMSNQRYKGYIAVGLLNGDERNIICLIGMPFQIVPPDIDLRLRRLLGEKSWVEKILSIKKTFNYVYDRKSGTTLMQTILHIELRLDTSIRKYYRDIVDFYDDVLREAGAHTHYIKRLLSIPVWKVSLQS